MESRTKSTFTFVFLTLFVDLLAFTLILPLLPKILDYYATNDKSNAYKLYNENVKSLQNLIGIANPNNQVLLAGVLGSWFSLLQFVSSPFLGALSDKFGRKSVLVMAMSGSVVSYAIWLISGSSFALFILSRTIGGLSKANVGLLLAVVSDVSDESTRGKGMAMIGTSFSLAFIVGPLFGAYLSTIATGEDHLQHQLIVHPALIALFLSVMNVALVVIFFRETNITRKVSKDLRRGEKVSNATENTLTKAFHYVNPKSLFDFYLVDKNCYPEEHKVLTATGLIYFSYLLFYSGLEFTLSFLTHIRFGFSSMDQGKLYLFSGILMAIIQGCYIRRIKSGRESNIAFVGLMLIVPSFMWMGFSSRITHVYQSLTLYAMSSAIVVPCLTTIISLHSPVESRGVVMGTFRSIGALARAIGPGLASLIFWTFGPTSCYVAGALALLIPLYLMKRTHKLMRSNNQVKQLHDKKSPSKFTRKVLAKAS